MKQVNFLNSFSKRKSRLTSTAQMIALIAIGTMAVQQAKKVKIPSFKKAPVVASQTIPRFIAAPPPSRVDQLRNDLKTRTIAEKALNWKTAGADIEITLPSDSLFQIGSASFDGKIEPELRNLVQWLSERNGGFRVTIESHTDDTPIVKHRKIFKTNWELSAARAGAVAGIFQGSRFPATNLEAVGFADSRPVGSDRNQNRRIVLRFTDENRGGT